MTTAIEQFRRLLSMQRNLWVSVFLFGLFGFFTSPSAAATRTTTTHDGASAASTNPLQPITQVEFPTIRDVTQDEQGFVWFAANDRGQGGLIRFDGFETKRYAHDPGDETSLSNNAAWRTYVDNDGDLWVGINRGGLNRYNADTDNFTRYLHDPNDATTIPSDDIKSLLQTTDGRHWVGTNAGFAYFDPDTGVFTSYFAEDDDPDGLPDSTVYAMAEDPATGEIWLGTDMGLSIFDPEAESYRNYHHDPDDPTSLSDDSITAVLRDAKGVWWVATDDGLNRYRPVSDDFERFGEDTGLGSNRISSLLEDRHAQLWVGHQRGLQLFDRTAKTAGPPIVGTGADEFFAEAEVTALMEGDDGGIWVATRQFGAARISPLQNNFTYERHDPNNPDSVGDDFVARLAATDDGLWIVSTAGVQFADYDFKTFTDYTKDLGLEEGWPTVFGAYAADDGSLWLGYNDGRFTRFDPASGGLEEFEAPAPADNTRVWPVAESANGDIWYISYAYGIGVVRADGTGELAIGEEVDDDSDEPAYAYTTSTYFDKENRELWVTGLGLTKFDLETGEPTVYYYEPENRGSYDNQLWSVDAGPDGTLWLASNLGLHKFDRETGAYEALYYDELPEPEITDAKADADGKLWLVNGATLMRFDPDTLIVETFSADDERFDDDHLRDPWVVSKFVRGADDKMYAPTADRGVVSFAPRDIADSPAESRLVLTGFELFGKDVEVGDGEGVLSTAINRTRELDLAYDQNSFTFEFSQLNFEVSGRKPLAYRLEGFDDDWHILPSSRNFATYTNVPSGDYMFRVSPAGSIGDDADDLAVNVEVATPWWQTSLFRAFVLIAAIAGTVGIFRWRTVQQRRRNEELERELEERKLHEEYKEVLLTAMRDQSQRLRSVMDTTPSGVVTLDHEHRVGLVNLVASVDLDTFGELSADGKLIRIGEIQLAELLRDDRVGAWTTTTLDERGQRRYLAVTARPVDDADASSRGWVVVWDDFTQLHELELANAQQDRLAALGRFAAGIAHDVNNVLTVIGLNVDLLAMNPTLDDKARSLVNQIVLEVGRADRFMTRILDYSRRNVSQLELLDARRTIAAQVEGLAGTMPAGVSLTFVDHGSSPLTVRADATQLEQVVLNLITNAQHAVQGRGHIRVSTEQVELAESRETTKGLVPRGSWVRISVTDDGLGIPDDVLPAIFEPFVTTKPVEGGAGLGLAQVAGITQDHGGHVTVDTEVHKGTTFSVYLPLVGASERTERPETPAPVPARRGAGEVVLVVDDDPGISTVLEKVLTGNGFNVLSATNGRDALDIVERERNTISVVLTDLMMPGMGGEELLDALAERRYELPVIVMSGMANVNSAPLDRGLVVGFVRKPIDTTDLFSQIAVAIDSARAVPSH